MATDIHPTAIVADGAELDDGVTVGPYCIIGAKARVGSGTTLVSNVSLDGDIVLGAGNTVYPYATLGFAPQDTKYKNEDTRLVIGDNNQIREYVSIHRASVSGDGETTVGNNNFLMAYMHVGHDCKLGDNIIVANGVPFGGHCEVGDYAVVGGLSAVHQFTKIGAYSMVAGFSRVSRNVPPYIMAAGAEKAQPMGLNVIGLKRGGFSDEAIAGLKKAYRILFREKISLKEAIKKAKETLPETDALKLLIDFMSQETRSVCR